MSEKRTISGVRTDLSPSEFSAKIDSTTPKGQARKSKVKRFFGNLGEVLSSLGFIPVLKSSSSTSKVYRGHSAPVHHSGNSFKESYRVETPPRRTHEQWLIDEMAHQAYHDMVDGKGDHDCGHEH